TRYFLLFPPCSVDHRYLTSFPTRRSSDLDDAGMAHSVNRATLEALEKGWITSSSILVPCPWFAEVARWARAHPDADLGIHLALNSEWTGLRWGPVTGAGAAPSLLDADGYLPLAEPTVVQQAKPADVERELRAQIDRAKAAGVRLTHLDSHMGTLFGSSGLFEVYRRLGAAYGLPLLMERRGERGGSPAEFAPGPPADALVDRVLGVEPGVPAASWREAYQKMLAPLPPGGREHVERVGLRLGAQAEMAAHVVLREVARPALDEPGQGQLPRLHLHDGADRVGVLPLALELHEQPVARVRELVVQDLRGAVEIVDDDVEPAVVVEIADGQPAAHPLLGQGRSELRRDLLE